MKLVKMEDDIHLIAKEKAKNKGMTLQGYLKFLVIKDKK